MRSTSRQVSGGVRSGARLLRRAVAVAGLAVTLCAAPASAATLKADYEFQDTHASTVPTAPSLTDLMTAGNAANAFVTEPVGGTPRRVLAFPKGNGLALGSLQSLIPSGAYSVVLLVRLAEVTGYRRYLDFTGGTADRGFYNLNGSLNLYPVATGSSALITPGAYHQIAATRDAAGMVAGYVGATATLGPLDDSTSASGAITTDVLRFFKDDDAVSSEESAGAVARIRVFEGALTAAEVAALAPLQNVAPPAPVLGEAVNLAPVSGEVLVSVPGGSARASASVPGLKGRSFVPLSQARQVPVGSILDTRRGTVRMTTASTSPSATQSADFGSGVFQVLQSRRRSAKGLTELRLKGASFRACSTSAKNGAARASRRSRRTIRRLRGNGRGRFRTRGRYSAATVRGTDWTVSDRCDGTLTKVRRGKVTVRDFRRRKSVVVQAGKRYLARP